MKKTIFFALIFLSIVSISASDESKLLGNFKDGIFVGSITIKNYLDRNPKLFSTKFESGIEIKHNCNHIIVNYFKTSDKEMNIEKSIKTMHTTVCRFSSNQSLKIYFYKKAFLKDLKFNIELYLDPLAPSNCQTHDLLLRSINNKEQIYCLFYYEGKILLLPETEYNKIIIENEVFNALF